MGAHAWLGRLDPLHQHARLDNAQLPKRMLTGDVFGVEMPAWIIFHAMLGYIILAVGLCTLLLRLPIPFLSRRRWLHRYLGYIWIFGTIWMPVTAIWCVYSYTGWDVIAFFIFSMYATIQLGWLFVQAYKSRKESPVSLVANESSTKTSWKVKILMVLHGIAMGYSFIMLLGAGVSFPLR